MKKHHKILLVSLLVLVVAGAGVFVLYKADAFVFDYSAEFFSSERMIWDGKEYSAISGDYTEGRTIARDKNGNLHINTVEQDPSHTFVAVRSFLDNYLMVADDYAVPEAGELTTVSWNGEYITDTEFLNALAKIEDEKQTSFTFETEGIFRWTENQRMRRLYFAYENCPVATNFKGYMGKVNGKWVITTYISQDVVNEDGSPKPYSVGCYEIPEEYWDILSKYFG